MMDVLLLRFDAPLMSFGGVRVDHHNRTDAFPYRAMLAGLLANALGYERRDAHAHEALQERLRYAARLDRSGTTVVDYQTVDFDPDGAMASTLAWTTRGLLEERKGGDASEGTHIRYRHYLADAIVTVALALEPSDASPTLGDVARALRQPARPLFLGRKCCVPSGPILLGQTEAESLRHALESTARVAPLRTGDLERTAASGPLLAMWVAGHDEGVEVRARLVARVEDRDWHNAVHVGRRFYVEGLVEPPTLDSAQRRDP